jgi:hypothetical protein
LFSVSHHQVVCKKVEDKTLQHQLIVIQDLDCLVLLEVLIISNVKIKYKKPSAGPLYMNTYKSVG